MVLKLTEWIAMMKNFATTAPLKAQSKDQEPQQQLVTNVKDSDVKSAKAAEDTKFEAKAEAKAGAKEVNGEEETDYDDDFDDDTDEVRKARRKTSS
ncbi:hypothetical protein P3T76_000122 [Phytophthora citrophthora]|uniref:Uncharacterized protein n=1 Tax=Phytophthora citrophthora TaxID=4793 RepID=A0AAD9GZQ5_9STRA|nr:hypothetical protein P3T76_000122 [Phytophthora citrophthora]